MKGHGGLTSNGTDMVTVELGGERVEDVEHTRNYGRNLGGGGEICGNGRKSSPQES